MCLEDIKIGRDTVDRTVSRKQVFGGTDWGVLETLTVPPNPARIALNVWGRVLLLGDNPEQPTNRSFGWVEIWVDRPTGDNHPFTDDVEFNYVYGVLDAINNNKLFWIGHEGLICQRQFTLRPANLDSFNATDVIIYLGFTEYTFPHNSAYPDQKGLWK